MHEHASKMELGDKETVAICIQASVTCYLHLIHRYTRMVRTIRVWYTKLYHTRMVQNIIIVMEAHISNVNSCSIRNGAGNRAIRVRFSVHVFIKGSIP